MKVAIYARVSTNLQRERQTIASQLRLLPEYATANGWQVIETYVDDGISGETVDARPGFQKLLGDAERKLFEAVLVIDLDRITRSRRSAEGALIYDHLREHKVKIATPGQGVIDLEDEDQDLLAGIKRELAKWEKRKILSRMMRGKREAARQARRFGCRDPYGLRWTPDPERPRHGAYEEHPEEAEIVRRIFRMATEEQLGVAQILWRLNHEGHRTRPTKKRPEGGFWPASTIKKILHSPTYRGAFEVFKRRGERITIPVPIIINPETWTAAQAALRVRRPEARWKHDRRYLLSGLARCGVCGAAMWVVNARPGLGRMHAYYRCSTTNGWRKMQLEGPCGNVHHRVARIDEAVWARLIELFDNPTLLAEACALETAADQAGVDWEAQRRASGLRLGDLRRLESEVLGRRRRGLLSEAACDQELAELAREREFVARNLQVAESQLQDRLARDGQRQDLEARVSALRTRLTDSGFEERRELLRALTPPGLGKVVIHRDGRTEILGVLELDRNGPSIGLNVNVYAKVGDCKQ